MQINEFTGLPQLQLVEVSNLYVDYRSHLSVYLAMCVTMYITVLMYERVAYELPYWDTYVHAHSYIHTIGQLIFESINFENLLSRIGKW